MPIIVAVLEVVNGEPVPGVAHVDDPSGSTRKRAAVALSAGAVAVRREHSAILNAIDGAHCPARCDAAEGWA
jgi:hypothetical protein